MRAPMGQAVIGGVITSSLLTLVVVPVVYCYMDDLAQWLRTGHRGKSIGKGHKPWSAIDTPEAKIETPPLPYPLE
jgi:hypothetical protein